MCRDVFAVWCITRGGCRLEHDCNISRLQQILPSATGSCFVCHIDLTCFESSMPLLLDVKPWTYEQRLFGNAPNICSLAERAAVSCAWWWRWGKRWFYMRTTGGRSLVFRAVWRFFLLKQPAKTFFIYGVNYILSLAFSVYCIFQIQRIFTELIYKQVFFKYFSVLMLTGFYSGSC